MANDLVPSGDDGSLVVSVDSRKAIAGLNKLEARMYGFVHSVQNRFNQVANSTNTFASAVSALSNKFSTLLKSIAGFIAIRQVLQMLSAFVSRMIEIDRAFQGFIASMSVIKGSVQGARQEYQFLLDMSNKLGVSVESAITQYHRLAASLKNVDTTGELTRHIFSGISQAAVVLHSRGHDVTLIFEAVQQMASKGKLSLEELQRQLGNTLPGAISMAARAMMQSEDFIKAGVKTAAEAEQRLRRGIEKGTINVYEFLARLANQLKKEYGEGVKYASDQFTANFNRMKNSVFELYRMVGSSDAMKGFTALIREITGLFNDTNGNGAAGLGQAIGGVLRDMASWVSKLDSSDVLEFFDTVSVAIKATMIVVKEFMGSFSGIGGPEMKTPLLDFVEFTARSMAALVDVFRVAIAGIETSIRLLLDLMNQGREAMYAIPDWAVNTSESIMDNVGFLDNAAERQRIADYRKKRAGQIAGRDENFEAMKRSGSMFLYGPGEGNTAYDKVGAAFGQARAGLVGRQMGVTGAEAFQFNVPGTQSPVMPSSWSAVNGSGLPSYLLAGGSNKAGSTADAAAAYVNPLGDYQLQQQIDALRANSGAPNPAKPKGGNGKKDPVQSNFLREQTRLLKDIAVAENEYQNVLSNRNLSEGEALAQMRSLITTDERYVALSDEKKGKLLAWAQQLDDANRKVQDAIKAQGAWNDALQTEFDVQSRIADLAATGYESRYRALADVMNSFKEGGENQFMAQENRRKMAAAAERTDNAQRILDITRYAAEVRHANDEMVFQSELVGKSALEQQKLTEFRKIDLQTQQMMVGATDAMKVKYMELAAVLKGEVADAFDEVARKQADGMVGVMTSVNAYMDQVKDQASEWGQVTTNALSGMEDALVSFVETGKLSFSDLARSMAKDLVRLITRYMLLLMLQRLTGAMAASSGGGSGVSSGGFSGGGTDYSGVAQSYGGGGLPAYDKGGAFMNGVQYFGKGGVFAEPFAFPMSGGKMGVGSESRPEAIMPLARDSSGSLGVKMVSGGDGDSESVVNLTVEVYQGEGKGVRTERGQNEKGDVLKILIGEVAADVQRGGPVGKAITQVFGVKRRPKVYS